MIELKKKKRMEHVKPIEWIYMNNGSNELRYALGEKGNRMVGCIGINPSTARPDDLDNTLGSVKRIAEFNGYDGWVMFNICPQRATDISEIDYEVNPYAIKENLSIVKSILIEYNIGTVWLAFGNLIEYRPYLKMCFLEMFAALKGLDVNWKIIQEPTQKGHPRHPLYKPVKSTFVDFDIQRYVSEVLKG